MAMDVNTGRVLAMQGGFSYQHSSFNRATQATRQPGSSFKPFVYAAALDSGYSPNTIIIDAPIEVRTPEGVWRPQNASNRFYGPSPLRTGVERSRNLMTVRLAQDVGMETVARYAERFGVYDDMQPFLANALGSQETTLFRMVAAYSMFANGGERVEPTLVDRIQDRWGNTVYRHDRRLCPDCELASLEPGLAPAIMSNRERVMDPITAYQLTSMMRGVVDRGTAAGSVNLPVPTAGKTGTTNDARDVWFVGFTSSIAAGCYIGYDQPQPLGRGASGGGMCGPVFNEFMREAIEEYGGGAFEVPEGGVFYPIDRFSGQRLPDGAQGENVVYELFRDGEEPYFGVLSIIDGGWGMGSDLPIFGEGEAGGDGSAQGGGSQDQSVTTSTGEDARVPTGTGFGTLSSGGLY
jgi:penicillin-binding protein 1A